MSDHEEDPVGYGLDALFDFVNGTEFVTKDGRKVRVQAVDTVDPKSGATEHVETTGKASDGSRRSESDNAGERLRIEHVFRAPKSTKSKRTHRTAADETADTQTKGDDSDSQG